MTERAGLEWLDIDGTRYDVVDDIEYNLGGRMRETLTGADRVHGYKSRAHPPSCSFQIRDSGDLDVAALRGKVNATITARLSNGKTIVWNRAFATGEWGQAVNEGTISAEFGAMSASEI